MQGSPDDEFVQLDRTFHELPQDVESDDVELRSSLGFGEKLTWSDLISHHRVVLLSEAGSGKTVEIRNTARRLRREGKPAFFLRLEYIVDEFEDAFEEGAYGDFLAWVKGADDGWVLLDSVDEARLRDPSDFERAIRTLARRLSSGMQRAHVVITGRASAWRPKTDLTLCRRYLPYVPPSLEETGASGAGHRQSSSRQTASGERQNPIYKIVAFDDLSPRQIEVFAKARGTRDTAALLNAVKRADALSFTSRPQDLEDLVAFWKSNGRIGSRFERIQDSVKRRLEERDQNRADVRPTSTIRLRDGARLVAAACTLAQSQTIRIPDGADNARGLPIKEILVGWDDRECDALLSRPVFDAAIYGAGRFHHRTVREFLTAEWFANLLGQATSRRRVEELFFREQYGLQVVVPSLRPVLPWLSLMDSRIRDRVCKLAPEVLFEGGDPTQLPLETRRQILYQVCNQIAGGPSGGAVGDFYAFQRFCGEDLTGDVTALIKKYADNRDLQWFLLRMVWQGQLCGALHVAKRIGLDSGAARSPRIEAFRAVNAVGSDADKADVRTSFLAEPAPLDRELLGALVEDADPTAETIDWLFDCIAKVARQRLHSVDDLSRQIVDFIERAAPTLLASIVSRANALLESEPVMERRHCEVSAEFAWLLGPAAVALQRIVKARSAGTFATDALAVLHKLPLARDFSRIDIIDSKHELATLVPEWPELNLALFWHRVEHHRSRMQPGESLTDWWQVGVWDSYVRFDAAAFDAVLACVADRRNEDDRLIALTLAHHLYVHGGRPARGRRALRAMTSSESVLRMRLAQLMRPARQSRENANYRRAVSSSKRRADRRKRKEAANVARWHEVMRSNLDALRAPKLKSPDGVNTWQHWVHERMRDLADKSSGRKERDWSVLNEEFGPEIARAFRDGVVEYWRRHTPKLRSEGAPADKLNFEDIFGLTGLDIESRETPDWPSKLNASEAELAFRYAMHELNGFPDWLPRLFAAFPEVVRRMSIAEIEYELRVEDPEKESFYLLHDVTWCGDWLWNTVAPDLYRLVGERETQSAGNLQNILKVLNGSSLSNLEIARLASTNAKGLTKPEHTAAWYATWVGVEPDAAIAAIRAHFAEIEGAGDRTTFAMLFVTALGGDRRIGNLGGRQAYRTPAHLKDLYLLVHEHVRREHDIDRIGQGTYSPGLRDNAQDARNYLLRLLMDLPGKETYLALEDIARAHPDRELRPWFVKHATSRAERDADNPRWTVAQVRDFQATLERTPANHRDLFDLAVMRLSDLKDDLENGDSSIANTLSLVTQETEMRKVIGNWCREHSAARYHVPQEEELADAKRPDIRFLGVGFDGPVPIELKLVDNDWSGAALYERMEVQLCGDYLRDRRSTRGIFLLVYRGEKHAWELPDARDRVGFDGLVQALQNRWKAIAHRFAKVDEIRVIGIDLTKRMVGTRVRAKRAGSQAEGSKGATIEKDVNQ